MFTTVLTMSLLCFSMVCAGNQFLLTVEDLLQPPTADTIQRTLEARGGTFTPAYVQQIQVLVQEILQGTFTYSVKGPKRASKHVSRKGITTLLTSAPCTTLTQSVFTKLNTQLPSLVYSSLMKRLLEACYTAHSSITAQKEALTLHDQEIASSPILRTAHALALETVMGLLYIMASPMSHPCERMHALYLMNTVHLYGSPGVALERFRARANRFYFTYEGLLREYDPTKDTGKIPKHAKAFARFMKLISHSKTQYLTFLTAAIKYGIIALKPFYEAACEEGWSSQTPGFGWRYAASIFKEVTTLDVIEMRTIAPEKIFAHQANKDLMSLMLHCSLQQTEPHLRNASLQEAYSTIITYKNEHIECPYLMIMQQYYRDSCKRYKAPF